MQPIANAGAAANAAMANNAQAAGANGQAAGATGPTTQQMTAMAQVFQQVLNKLMDAANENGNISG